jgi:hypothetical protein
VTMNMTMSDHLLYIRGNLTCDGSPTIMDVWDGRKIFWCSWKDHDHEHVTIFYIYKRKPNVWWVTNYHRCVRWKKNFFCFSVTMNMCDHLLYIYKMRPNVWWVTNYHGCVRWKKNFFWFSMTNTNVCCVSLVCVSWHKNIFCRKSPPVMVMWRFWFAR